MIVVIAPSAVVIRVVRFVSDVVIVPTDVVKPPTAVCSVPIEVSAPGDAVVVYRGVSRETYSCSPLCGPRIMLGDNQQYFEGAIAQVVTRNNQAQGVAPASK